MTAFVLVAGAFTEGWVWQEVAARLEATGDEAHPVTLGAGDLDGRIAELVGVLDGIAAPQVVLVGHDTGIRPVLGAAEQRPERVERLVYLDAGPVEDGETAAQSLTDQRIREELAGSAADRSVPPPAGDWRRWGSTDGLSEQALAELDRRAVPEPAAVLTQPLRLTGRSAGLPSAGILCTAQGRPGIAMVETLVRSGPPQFRALAGAAFFELATGHWPMLSAPAELAGLLRRAAAGEGYRVSAAGGREPAGSFPLDVPECPRERRGPVDLHLPVADGPRPAVVFVHGGPLSRYQRPTPRDTMLFTGYGRYAASLGVVGAVPDHRLYGLGDFPQAAADLAEAVELVRADPRVDGDRLALWVFSGGGLLTADHLAAPPPWLRCLAASYPILAPLPGWHGVDGRFRPLDAVRGAGGLPIVLTRAGREDPAVLATVTDFLAAAAAAGTAAEVIDVPLAKHGFDAEETGDWAREAVQRAMRSVLHHLGA